MPQAVLTPPSPLSSNPVPDAQALIEEARRRHRRRRFWTGISVAALTISLLIVYAAIGGFSGSAHHKLSAPSGGSAAPSAPPVVQSSSQARPGIVGTGPTSIDFYDPNHGWIASGCTLYCYHSNPVIVRTHDGGRTWQQMDAPDMAAAPVAGSTWYQYGGVVVVRFVSLTQGWYLDAGELWSTDNGGATWRLIHLGGVVSTMTTSDDGVWALVDDCPGDALLPCTPFHLYHRSIADPHWQHSPTTLFPGNGEFSGSTLVADGDTAFVSVPGHVFSASPNGAIVAVDSTCEPIGPLTPGRLVGICDEGGGGNASTVSFATSTDQGRNWVHLVGGPPSDGWSGPMVTNGDGALFYVTGGTTLWRLDGAGRTWAQVLHTTPNTTDEFYPMYFAGDSLGFVGENGSSGVHLLETRDAGLTWSAVPLP